MSIAEVESNNAAAILGRMIQADLGGFYSCNSFKGPNLAVIDPDSRRIVRLFHLRDEVRDARHRS